MTFRPLFAFVLIALAGCSGPRALSGSESIKVVSGTSLPPPEAADLFGQKRPYLIGPFDKLTISVFGIEELKDREVSTDASGRVQFPLVGAVEAAGKTPEQLSREIAQRLRGSYVRDPQVTVNLKETVSQVITVDGQVREPGLYPVIGEMTLMRAVATAKGTAEFARLDDVVVFRKVNGQDMAALYNLKAIRRGTYPDPQVYANDVVVVGDSQALRLFRTVLQASPLITTPIVALLQRN